MSSIENFALRGPYQRSTLSGKDVDMSSVERDAGFCSGGDDEELEDLHSPTDASEDSVEVKVEPISLRNKNKRKCAEPRKVPVDDVVLRPYKKRRHFIQETSNMVTVLPDNDQYHGKQSKQSPNLVNKETLFIPRSNISPFRPWSNPRPASSERCSPTVSSPPSKQTCPSTQVSPPPFQYMERVPELPNQVEPLSLVKSNKIELIPNVLQVRLDRTREPEQSTSCESRIVIKSEYPSVRNVPESPRRLEITGHEQRRYMIEESGSKVDMRRNEFPVGNEVRRLHFGNTLEIKKEPEHFGSHPYTQTRPIAEDGFRLKREETAVDFTTNPGPSRAPDACYSRAREGTRDRRTLSEMANDDRVICSPEDMTTRTSQSKCHVDSLLNGHNIDDRPGPSSTPSTSSDKKNSPLGANQQRNYKNMTRERRVEANARERTRVHTISAAFDTLRRTIPAYSHNQKLSKLSVLRIACSYILTLSRVAGSDYSADNSEPSLADCVDYVSRTIQTEGKLRKKKDE